MGVLITGATARAINADAAAVMVEQMASAGGKVVHVSTDCVLDSTSPVANRLEDARNPLPPMAAPLRKGRIGFAPRTSWSALLGSMPRGLRTLCAP